MLIDKEFNLKESLLLHKALPPLNIGDIEELERIQNLDVSGFTEADVRAEVIDPIIRILGYRKGNFSSVDREKHIKFLGKTHKYIDYTFTLWQENFWLIEAKRPLHDESFGYSELSQAIEYSIHPQINASIIVLCDGVKLELFDREEDVEKPTIHFKIKDLIINFDLLRKVLNPINIWFFYKRRVLKSIDKAFESEFNQSRVNEFLQIIENRLREKRDTILKNFQSTKFTDQNFADVISKASIDEIIDIHFFFSHTASSIHEMNTALTRHCQEHRDFDVISRILPDHYRDTNDFYYMNAMSFLIHLEKQKTTLNWAPSWLTANNDRSLDTVIKSLIRHCLSYFKDDEPRRIILLAASTFRRILKIFSIVAPETNQKSEIQHLLTRLNESEFSWNQILSSAERNILIDLDRNSILATDHFVSEFTVERYKFNTNLAKQRLSQLWQAEKLTLEKLPNYFELLNERNLDEFHPTEAASVFYDNLGHSCLCIIKSSQKWKEYILNQHINEVTTLACLGSWAAREILDISKSNELSSPSPHALSNMFFFGDGEIQNSLMRLYKRVQSH